MTAKRGVSALGAWVLLTLSVGAPQLLLPLSTVLAVAVGLVLLAGWAALLFFAAVTPKAGLIGAGLGLVVVALTHGIGTPDFQAALSLSRGRALDGVTLAALLEAREQHLWASLSDARVRSEAAQELTFVSGGGQDADGTPRAEHFTRMAFAPVTLATDVSNEEPSMRRRPTGRVMLWACAGNTMSLQAWDRERQAVRGVLTRIEPDVYGPLAAKFTTAPPSPIPGAGFIPPAPGEVPSRPVPTPADPLRLDPEAWCITLDRALDAATAREQAVSSSLVFVFSIPFFTALFAFFIALVKGEDA
ncbi:MAG: hypothetical protein Q8S33_01730 [Myxococcales bacterium]|nr:hypothetical protein [Myxococcales bacterium]